MATDFTAFSRQFDKTSPLDSDVKVLHAYVRNIVTAEVNMLVPIPWENQRLVKAVACVAEAIAATALEIDLELNIAGGTEMMSITIAKSSAVGQVLEGTVSNQSACERLGGKEGVRDAINIEKNDSAGSSGAVNLYMIFEPDTATN